MRMKTPLISVKYTFCPELRQFVVEGRFVKLYFKLMIFFSDSATPQYKKMNEK